MLQVAQHIVHDNTFTVFIHLVLKTQPSAQQVAGVQAERLQASPVTSTHLASLDVSSNHFGSFLPSLDTGAINPDETAAAGSCTTVT
jgi:hypothetical protein